jgi:solute carrier family 6 (neurotransmitter transporter, glycine) member 5/9
MHSLLYRIDGVGIAVGQVSIRLPFELCQLGFDVATVESGQQCQQFRGVLLVSGCLTVISNPFNKRFDFRQDVLHQKLDISDGLGPPHLNLSLLLLAGWVIVFLVLCRGVRASGKTAYFLALFPYVVLITLLIHGLTLDGALEGVLFLYKPNWKELHNPVVWKEAVVQCFFSLAVFQGSIVMYCSYNKFEHPMHRDAFIITSLDTFTSLLGGTTIFAILGNLAHNLGIENINEVVAGGSTLAFISYPDAIAKFAVVPQFFSCLFFFMLFILGLGSGVALHNTSVSAIWDAFPHITYWKILLGQTIFTFFLGLIYVTEGGQWMLILVDFFGGSFSVLAIAIVEMIAIFWIYGLDNFCDDLEFMTGTAVSAYLRICWKVVTPLMMGIIFVYSMFVLESPTYSGLEFPPSLIVLGWCIFSLGLLQVPAWCIHQIVKVRRAKQMTVWEAILVLLKPSDRWGPKDDAVRQKWLVYKQEAVEMRQTMMAERGHMKFQKFVNSLLGKYNADK